MKSRLLRWLTASLSLTTLLLAAPAWGAPDCEALAKAAARLLTTKSSCAEVQKQREELSAALRSCAKDAQFVAQLNLTRARLQTEQCLCENVEQVTRTAQKLDPQKASCEQLADSVSTLVVNRGSCPRPSVRDASRAAEKRLTDGRTRECSQFCDELAQRIKKAGPSATAQDVGRCYGCGDATRKTCGEAVTPTSVDPTRQLLLDLLQSLDALNARIRETPSCSDSDGCQELELARLHVLTTFLGLLASAQVSGNRYADIEHKALEAMRVMGVDASIVKVLLTHSAEEVLAMAHLAGAASNPDLRKYLIEQLERMPSFEPILEALRQGVTIDKLVLKAQQMSPDERAQLYRVAGGVGLQQAHLRKGYLEQVLSSGLDVFLPQSACSGNCANCGQFWGRLRSELDSAQHAIWHCEDDVPLAFKQRLELRAAICAGEKSDPKAPGCGPVLAVRAVSAADGSVVLASELRYVRSEQQGAAVTQLAVPPHALPKGADARRQDTEARALASEVVYQFNKLINVPWNVSAAPSVEALSQMCGTRLIVDPLASTAPPAGGKLQLVGRECHTPAFKTELKRALDRHALSSRLDLGSFSAPAREPSEEDGNGSAEKPFKCSVDVLGRNASGNFVPVYSIAATIADSGCKESRETRWQHVARGAAWELAAYFSSSNAVHRDRGGAQSTKLQTPPYWHALYFTGARQLEHSRGKRGWAWAASEAGLLLAGATLAGLAVNARNGAQQDDAHTRTANLYLNGAYGAFLLVIPLRLMAGGFCCAEAP